MARLRSLGRLAALLMALGLMGVAAAQEWTVQTVALRDLRQAQTAVAQLRALGFDAYDEFAMSAGRQFVRVRVGCYDDRSAAQAAANALAGHVTRQAVAVTLSPTAKVTRCVQEEVGFLKPASWKRVDRSDGLPAYQVVVAGRSARLVFGGNGWRVVQAGATTTVAAASTGAATFESARPGGAPWVGEELATGLRLLCPGTLVASVGSSVVVERSDEVVACRFMAPPASLAGDGSP